MHLNQIEHFEYPFPHFVTKVELNFDYSDLECALENLPQHPSKLTITDEFQKVEIRDGTGLVHKILMEMQSKELIEKCQQEFGLSNLSNDFLYDGGGLTITEKNGYLKYHCDFPFSNAIKKYRVVNALLYLNSKDLIGGDLHLLDPQTKTVEKVIKPYYGLLLAFPTSRQTPHGFSRIQNGRRISVNSYFYSDKPLDDRLEPSKTEWLT